jgi:hypothetical protein
LRPFVPLFRNPHLATIAGNFWRRPVSELRWPKQVALSDLLGRFANFELATKEPWQPRKALHVYGPASLPIRFEVSFAREHRAAAPG